MQNCIKRIATRAGMFALCLAMMLSQSVSAAPLSHPQYAYVANRSVYFYDVTSAYSWAFHEIDYLATADIVKGTDDFLFHPSKTINRADFVLMLYRAYNMTDFTSGQYFSDVSPNAYYADAVLAARSLGIVTGENNRFYPTRNITRAEAFVMLARTLERAGISLKAGSVSAYKDTATMKDFAKVAAGKLIQAGIISGNTQNQLRPNAAVSRAEMAIMLYRALMVEDNGAGPRYVAHPDKVNLCIGDKIYSGATITNYDATRRYQGLVAYTSFEEINGSYHVSLGESAQFDQTLYYSNSLLRVNDVPVNMAPDCVAVQVEPYSVLSAPVSTGSTYQRAKVSYNIAGQVQAIYYTSAKG